MSAYLKSQTLGRAAEGVSSGVELVKAKDALGALYKVIHAVPSVRDVARKQLEHAISRLNKTVNIDAVYINRGKHSNGGIANRPTGSLASVLFHCLENFLLPNYVQGDDGVFHAPDTLSEQFKVQDLSITTVEAMITKVVLSMADDLRSALDVHWKGRAVASGDAPNNKQALQDEVTKVLMAELSLSVIAGSLKEEHATRVVELLKTHTPAFFQIKANTAAPAATSLNSSFIVDRSFHSLSEIKPDKELGGWVLYTPQSGFEYFSSSVQMHETLCARYSLSSNAVTYPLLAKNVFTHYVDEHLRAQRAAVDTLVAARAEKRGDWLTDLQNNQNLIDLWVVANLRHEALKVAIKRNEWPQWLKTAGTTVQQRYLELEKSKEQYEHQYQLEFDRLFSLRDFVLRAFDTWTQSALGEKLDPDKITIISIYKTKLAERIIEQKDTRRLSEFLLAGLHEAGSRAELSLEGVPAHSGLTVSKLETWLNDRDMRADFVSSLPAEITARFHATLTNCLRSRMEFALLVARHCGERGLNDAEVALIKAGMDGDQRVVIKGARFKYRPHPIKDVLIFVLPNSRAYYVFLRTPENTHEFLKFDSDHDFVKWFQETLARDRLYAESMINPADLSSVGTLSRNRLEELGYQYALGFEAGELRLDSKAPLYSYAKFTYDFEVLLHKGVASPAYLKADMKARQTLTMMNTLNRALVAVHEQENSLPSFEKYTHGLIKASLEEHLRSLGQRISVDPDLIMVQTDDFYLDLTSVLLDERVFEAAHPAYRPPGSNPKFVLKGGHPTLEKLDIRFLSELSKKLRPGDHYTRMLKERLSEDNPDRKFQREVHAQKNMVQMLYAAYCAYYSQTMDLGVFQAIKRVLRAFQQPKPGYENEESEGVYAFDVQDIRRIDGVYIFRLHVANGIQDYLYTPEAPDQVAFRPLNEFVRDIRFRTGPFREYYIKRVKLVDQQVVNNYFDRLQATVDTPKPHAVSWKARIKFLVQFEANEYRRILSDVDERTTSLNELIAKLVYDNAILVASVVSVFVPPVGSVITAVTLFKNLYDASQAHLRGDYAVAAGHLKDVVTGMVSLGKAAAAGASAASQVAKLTPVQRSLLDLAKDAKSAADLITQAMGQQTVDERLLEFVKELMVAKGPSQSETTVH